MTTIIKHVHVLRGGVLHSFVPGDELPEWAVDIITNPDVLREFPEPEEAADATVADSSLAESEEAADESSAPDHDALVARAHELKIRLRKDMSDAEIAAVIASKE